MKSVVCKKFTSYNLNNPVGELEKNESKKIIRTIF